MNDFCAAKSASANIRAYVGGHDITVFAGAQYDPATRKYKGGTPIAVIPYSGRMLTAYPKPRRALPPLDWNGAVVPLYAEAQWEAVDPLPGLDECDYAIVSTLYAAACRSLGLDTSRLLTVGGAVADPEGRTIGAAWLNKN